MAKWKKLGLLLAPQKDHYWMASHVGPSFVEARDGKVVVYVTGRDLKNVSRIGTVEIALHDESFEVRKISSGVLFDVGELGTFDESGVSYPWIVRHNSRIFMYYVGWVAGGLNRFQNFTGLAISDDAGKTFTRAKRVPILDRTDQEPFGTGSCSVFIENNLWKMFYTSFEPWLANEGKNRPNYKVRYAESHDGINWMRTQRVVLDFERPGEHVICKPMPLWENGVHKLWYSFRGASYRIGYAESVDGVHYVRKDQAVGIDVSPGSWDGEMIEYAFVFNHGGRKYMIYNGNDFGKTGLGIAVEQEEIE